MKNAILNGNTVLGIELGSTRIKAVLIGETHEPIASGSFEWENKLIDGIWTYDLSDVWKGLADCYRSLVQDVKDKYDVELTKVGALGISAMMHGYMAFNKEGELMVPFRTWRNAITEPAAKELTQLFQFNMPQRWSGSHLYQAILNGEEHVADLDYITTLSGYIHWKLTGRRVLGVGDCSGMWPIDSEARDWNRKFLGQFNDLIAPRGFGWKVEDIIPQVLCAGDDAGCLTEEGALLLDPSGKLQAGIPMCAPEGDAGTGMVATNSVKVRTGNVSAGTSVFAMIVLEEELKKLHEEIDMVTTPAGDAVAMVHCNNCTSDLNAWVNLFKEFAESFGMEVDMNKLYGTLYNKALEGDPDCGGLMAFNFHAGEPLVGFNEGRPLFVRMPDSKFSLANFMRANLYASIEVLRVGMDLLLTEEDVKVDSIIGHGGLFKTKGVGQTVLASALNAPVSVMETAGEGGAWGIAVLAAYLIKKEDGEDLGTYLDQKVFAGQEAVTIAPTKEDVEGYSAFIDRFVKTLPIMKAAVETMR